MPIHTKLSVNLNKVALLRNARKGNTPAVLQAARLGLEAGAHGITVHPRPDQRHIRFADVRELARVLRHEYPHAEFNIEGNPFEREGCYMEMVEELRPNQCTLVPDAAEQQTSDHGWDLLHDREQLLPIIKQIKKAGLRVSLFVDPEAEAIAQLASYEVKADRVELYTESYAKAYAGPKQEQVLESYIRSAQAAHALGLGVNAGHDLNQSNLGAFLRRMPQVLEVSIGHALIADALFIGLKASTKAYLDIIRSAVPAAPRRPGHS